VTLLLRRLDRDAARFTLDEHLSLPLEELGRRLPITADVTHSPVGGTLIDDAELRGLRAAAIAIAREHGYPEPPRDVATLEERLADLLHDRLRITANEASVDDVWSYLTCCWLLDVAVWRFGADADPRRFIGNVNRNTFRRLWWRREILGPAFPLAQLGEDELVNVMERPTIAGDRRLARSIVTEFLRRVGEDPGGERMQLMREAMKRLLRLTPFLSFAALSDREVEALVAGTFVAAADGLRGVRPGVVGSIPSEAPEPSPDVTPIASGLRLPGEHERERPEHAELGSPAEVAISIAEKTGRVTSVTLREALAMRPQDARAVLTALVDLGILARRGVRRGTHYVIASETDTTPEVGSDEGDAEPGPTDSHPADADVTAGMVLTAPASDPDPPRPRSSFGPPVGRFAAATRQLDGLRKAALAAATERRSPVAALADRAVEIVTANPGRTSVQIAGEVKISEGVLSRVLARLEREGRLVRRGSQWLPSTSVDDDG
jgi:hypothetical protein